MTSARQLRTATTVHSARHGTAIYRWTCPVVSESSAVDLPRFARHRLVPAADKRAVAKQCRVAPAESGRDNGKSGLITGRPISSGYRPNAEQRQRVGHGHRYRSFGVINGLPEVSTSMWWQDQPP